jgi:hypothetical protein
MTFMASTVPHHPEDEAQINRCGHSDEDNQYDPVASPYIRVKVCHVDFVGRPEVGFAMSATAAF